MKPCHSISTSWVLHKAASNGRIRNTNISIQKLQDQVWSLELLLAGQATLPSVASSHSRPGLRMRKYLIYFLVLWICEEGQLNMSLKIRPSSFHKQVRFEDNNSSPKVRPDVKSGGGRSAQPMPANAPRLSNISVLPNVPKFTSMLHRVASAILSDRTCSTLVPWHH